MLVDLEHLKPVIFFEFVENQHSNWQAVKNLGVLPPLLVELAPHDG